MLTLLFGMCRWMMRHFLMSGKSGSAGGETFGEAFHLCMYERS